MARRVSRPRRRTGDPRLPGDLAPERLIARMLRVDQAGEYGAVQIYKGQLAVLGRHDAAAPIRRMADAEAEHLARFEALIAERRVRPTLLQPLWRLAGYALGAGTALIGPKAAMACTVAVEEVIDRHYAGQIATLGEDEKELKATLEEFRRDEVEHGEAARRHGAEQTPGYRPLTAAIKAGSRLAIWLSERL
jgi:ubiquinone biosynthesis monooxygenase Coq7